MITPVDPTSGAAPDADAPGRAPFSQGRRRRRHALAGAAVLAGGLGVAACSSGTASTPTTTAAAPGTGTGTVSARNVTGVGTVLVDSSGRTLYLLSADRQKSATCATSTTCVAAWPPLDLAAGSTRPTAGTGIDASLLSTVQDPDGRMQVTYNGWPLYRFAGDSGAGQANGQGIQSFGGLWSAVTSAGHAASGSTSSGSSSSGGGSSGGY